MGRTEHGPATNLRMVDGEFEDFADHSPFVRERVRERLLLRINTLNLKHLQNTQELGLIDFIMNQFVLLLLNELETSLRIPRSLNLNFGNR